MYFTGQTIHTLGLQYTLPISQQRCTSMITSKEDPELGSLEQLGDNKFGTANEPHIEYQYCKELRGQWANSVMMIGTITFDPVYDKIYSDTCDISHCKYETEQCRTDQYLIVWEAKQSDLCKDIMETKILNEGTLTTHFSKENEHVYATIEELDMSFSSRADLPVSLQLCFEDSNLIGTPQGLIIETQEFNTSKTIFMLKSGLFKAKLAQQADNKGTRYMLNYVYRLVADQQRHMLMDLHYMECMNDKFHSIIIMNMLKDDPSTVLSSILKKSGSSF